MNRIYIIQYKHYLGELGKYAINIDGSTPKPEINTEMFKYSERQDFIERYLHLSDKKYDVHYEDIKCYCILSLDEFEINMKDVINSI